MPVRRCPFTKCSFKTDDVNDNLAAVILQIHASDLHKDKMPELSNRTSCNGKEESDSTPTTLAKQPAGKVLFERRVPVAAGNVLMEGAESELESDLEEFSDGSFEDIPPLDNYPMNHKNRGNFLIFNHERFTNGHSARRGTSWDEVELCTASRKLGFQSAKTFSNFTIQQVEDKLEEISQQDFSDHDCLVCCYLTHGNNRGELSTKDHLMKVSHLWYSFTSDKCPGLAGKPKIFIIQACRGTKQEEFARKEEEDETDEFGSEGEDDTSDSAYFHENEFEGFYLPDDVILAYATIPGFLSLRNPNFGSYFIQSLCTVIKKQPYLEINQMLIRTNNEVIARLRKRKNGKRAQVSCFQSTLTKQLRFQPDPYHP